MAAQSGRHVEEAVGGAERQLSAAGYSAWQLRRRRRQQVEDHVDDARQIQTGCETENDVFKRQQRMDGVGGVVAASVSRGRRWHRILKTMDCGALEMHDRLLFMCYEGTIDVVAGISWFIINSV